MEPRDFKLPLTITGKAEVARLQRELSRLDDFFVDAAKRKPGQPISPPRITHALDDTARLNGINLLEAKGRKDMSLTLAAISAGVPSLHISFAAEPSPKALETVLQWLRANIHPQTLISIGLQPTIAAGCVLRTPNKIFDFSVGAKLKDQEEYLAKLIDGAVRGRS